VSLQVREVELLTAAARQPRRDHGGSGAFTLIEMIVVLLVMAVGTALVVPMVEGGFESREVRRAARQIASTMHFCRGEAVALGKPQEMIIDANENSIHTTAWGRWAVLTDRAVIDEVQGGNVVGDGVVQLVFYPNGSTSGADIVVAGRRDRREHRLRVSLDPLLGIVHVGDAE
jgi:general secretion pathway protein H